MNEPVAIMSLYDELLELKGRLDRVLPPVPPLCGHKNDGFRPGRDMVIEAAPAGVWRLKLDPKHWRLPPAGIPALHADRTSRRWYARRVTQHGSTWGDQDCEAPVPDGVRLWHASEAARKLLVHARHDLEELFANRQGLPQDEERLLVTPRQILGYRDGVALLSPCSPYLVRLCAEYARTACWLYGLQPEEFATLTRMCVVRHVYPFTPITLQETGGGVYDSGPVLSVHVGTPQVAHELSPILVPGAGPVRVVVAEGVLVVLDGLARAAYGRGYAQEPGSPTVFYTLEFCMDSMRETRYLGCEKATGTLVMHTPVVSSHAVEAVKGGIGRDAGKRLDRCAKRDLIRTMRARLQDRESHLLAGEAAQFSANGGENSPSSIMAE